MTTTTTRTSALTTQSAAPRQPSSRVPQRKRHTRILSGVASVLVSTVLFGMLLSGFDGVASGPGLLAQGAVGAVDVQRA